MRARHLQRDAETRSLRLPQLGRDPEEAVTESIASEREGEHPLEEL